MKRFRIYTAFNEQLDTVEAASREEAIDKGKYTYPTAGICWAEEIKDEDE